MSLSEQLNADLKAAMQSGDAVKVSTLRLLKAELQNAGIAATGSLSPEAELQVIRREVKKRKDAITLYTQAGNNAMTESEQAEASVLEQYLPAQADPAAVEAYVVEAISKLTERTPKEGGEVIRQTIAHFGGTADGSLVAQLVRQHLA